MRSVCIQRQIPGVLTARMTAKPEHAEITPGICRLMMRRMPRLIWIQRQIPGNALRALAYNDTIPRRRFMGYTFGPWRRLIIAI
ncbi:hypothetical protein THIOKS13200015 [Thiocapsa sp. KS1]|nr:hypothetical protein THIOKS13200015 [Thiocapsa sp. KS1]